MLTQKGRDEGGYRLVERETKSVEEDVDWQRQSAVALIRTLMPSMDRCSFFGTNLSVLSVDVSSLIKN